MPPYGKQAVLHKSQNGEPYTIDSCRTTAQSINVNVYATIIAAQCQG